MYSIGIDLGGTNIAIGLCDSDLNIIDKESIPTNAERGACEVVKDMANLTNKIVERNNLSLDDIEYVGIASPGSVDANNGMIIASGNIKMYDFPMEEEFLKHLKVKKLYLVNDANAAALGEALKGAGKNVKSSIMVTLGTGVGGGIVIDGKLFTGSLNCYGAELGHMAIVAGGRPCTCGRRGCFEAYCSATALISMTKEKINELKILGIPSLLIDYAEKDSKITGKTAFDAMKAGDIHAKEVVDNYIYYLACGITNLINIFQPEVVTLGGGICNQQETLLNPLKEIIDREQYTKTCATKSQILIAELKNDAGIIGAAAIGR